MGKKKLNDEAVVNELKGQSAFFGKGEGASDNEEQTKMTPFPSSDEQNEDAERISERKIERSQKRTENRSVQLPTKRETKRYSFEFYVDQLQWLNRMDAEAGLRGETFNKSAVMRDALDRYIDEVEEEQTERKSERAKNRPNLRPEKRPT